MVPPLVRVSNVTISDTLPLRGAFVLTVDDGSGGLEVLLDKDVGFSLNPFDLDVVIDAIGVLLPTGEGAWQLKPRSDADLKIK